MDAGYNNKKNISISSMSINNNKYESIKVHVCPR